MEEGAQAPDWDSDETVIEGSVTESDLEEDELPWRRLVFDQDTSLRSEFSFHPDISGTCKGTLSPEIQLRFKLRDDSQEQISNKKTMSVLSEDAVLQQPQDEMEQNQALLHAKTNRYNSGALGSKAENPEVLPHPEKELNAYGDAPEISLFSGTTITVSDLVAVKENLLIEPQKIIATSNTFSESGEEVTLTMTSEETKDEESSLETFVSALEKLLTSPENIQEEKLCETMSDFEPGELMNPLSNSPNSISIPLTCHRDLLENTKDDALPADLLAALNTPSKVKVGSIYHRKEGGSSLSTGNECLGGEPNMSQTDEDCTQIEEVNFESLCSTPPFEQDSKLAELQDKDLPVQQTLEKPNLFALQTLVYQNVISYNPLNNWRNSTPVENSSDQDPPRVLRRSYRMVGYIKYTDEMYKMPEKVIPKILAVESNNNSSTKAFRMQGPDLMIEDGKRKNMHLSRLKSRKQIWKKRKVARKNENMKMSQLYLSLINRRNIFGENLLYKAALHNDTHLVHHCIKKGGNVNQPSYAGWTALHEASVGGFYETVNELVKGGADVNIKGMYQITPLHDAVMNGHYKVAELLLLHGADPLFRSDNGKCAVDEAKDARMKRLLEKYVPKHQKYLISAQKNNTDLSDIEDTHQPKKAKFSSNNCNGFVCGENSNRQKPEHVKVGKGNKEGLFIKKEDVYEHYVRDFKSMKFGNSKHKQSAVNQVYSMGLRKNNLHDIKNPSTNISKYKGKRNIQHKRTQVGNAILKSNPRMTVAVSAPKRRGNHQHILQTLDDLPQELCKPFSPALSNLKNELDNNIDACSIPKETHTQNLDLSENQEIEDLELESSGQAKPVSFSGPSLHKEIKLPIVTTDQQPHTHQEQLYISSYKSNENSNVDKKAEDCNKWEIFNNDVPGDCYSSEKTVTFNNVICSTCRKSLSNYDKNITNREGMGFQQLLPSKDHFLQENNLKAGGRSILPQQETVKFSNSDNTAISEPHVKNFEQYTYGTYFDHSHGNPEHISLACTRTLSTHEISKLTSHVEQFKRPQDCSNPRVSTPLLNQTDTHFVEKVNKKEGTKKNYTDKIQNPNSSNGPLSTVAHSQVIETTTVEKRRQDLPKSEIIYNIDFHSTDNMNKELTNISQLSQREEKEIYHKADEKVTNNINGEERTVRDSEEKKDITDSEIHIPANIQEHHKVYHFKKRQNFLKAACSQEMKADRIDKRNARGESRLHLAARRGNLSLKKVLIDSGADVNLKDNAGWTPLHKASSEESNDIIVELLKAGANVNCENLDGILPLHDAVANNHLKAAEILLQHEANPNQRDQKQKTALDESDDEKLKELLKSYSDIKTYDNRKESDAVKISTVLPKRDKPCFYDDLKTVDAPSLSHQEKTRESLTMHQTITAILQDIEEKQENLLEFEIRTPKDAEQYTEKMLEIKEVMNDVLAKQKAERDDLAKKYRVSIESFKHGVWSEQLANLATRQNSLLIVAKKQKRLSQKLQHYKNATPVSGLSWRKLPSSSEISCEEDSQEFTGLEDPVQPQSGSFSPVSLACGSRQKTQLALKTWNDGQNTNTCLSSETVRREEFSRNELNSRQNINDCNLDGLSKSRPSDGTKKIKLQSQPVAVIAQAEYSQKEIDLIKNTAKDGKSYSPSAVTGTLNTSEITSVLAQNDAHPSAVICGQAFPNYNPKRRNRKTAFQQLSRESSKILTYQDIDNLGSDMGHQVEPYLKKSAFAVPHANDSQSPSSPESGHQHTTKKPLNYSPASKKKCVQIKDLIELGRMNPGNNILEFKTQETTHKASVLLSGKIKVESGKIYQNPVTWLKDLLGGESCVTWKYAWSKVTYLGKELLKYVCKELPIHPEPNLVPQQNQPSLPGTSRESMQNIPNYLQINEILLISDQEFLPCHIMDQHWKFFVECEELIS
ncbi:LOW QUALITY PROTEIN: ankyrin repeat domain-containing protein 31 [Rhynchonycteris naso]